MATILVMLFAGKVKTLGELAVYGLFETFLIATLFFISDLNNPFKGNVAIHPTAFKALFTGTFKEVP